MGYANEKQRDFYQNKMARFIMAWQSSNCVLEVKEKLDREGWHTTRMIDNKGEHFPAWARNISENRLSTLKAYSSRLCGKGIKLKCLRDSLDAPTPTLHTLDTEFLKTLAKTLDDQ